MKKTKTPFATSQDSQITIMGGTRWKIVLYVSHSPKSDAFLPDRFALGHKARLKLREIRTLLKILPMLQSPLNSASLLTFEYFGEFSGFSSLFLSFSIGLRFCFFVDLVAKLVGYLNQLSTLKCVMDVYTRW